MGETQKVKSFSLTPDKKRRTIRLDINLESEEKVSVSWPLPLITRLSDGLIEAEFSERFPDFPPSGKSGAATDAD
jgi:hypothetical protein